MNGLPDEVVENLTAISEDINSVLEAAVETSSACDVFTDQLMQSLTFYGKSLEVWEDEMVVPIPDGNLDSDTLRKLYVEVTNKIQKASHFYSLAMATHTVSSTGVNVKKSDLTVALMAHFESQNQKVPPNTVLERMADAYLKKLSNMSTITKLVRDFWKEKLNTLDKVDSNLSKIAILQATIMKYRELE
jgi:hypothetical protein